MAVASFSGDGPLSLRGEDYFDGPGEELWTPQVPGDEPAGWDAADEGIVFSPAEVDGLGLDAAERFGDVPGGTCPDGLRHNVLGEDSPSGRAGATDSADPGGEFGPGGPAEVLPAGAALHALVEQAVACGLGSMADDGVIGVVAAARRLRSHAEMLEVRATREFAHRRWESSTGPERDKNGRWLFKGRDAEFAADELAFELVESPLAVQERMDLSLALRDRLPQLDALLGNGVDLYRCRIVHEVTGVLSDEHARQVDALLAPEAAGLRYSALRRRARKLAMMADPDAERERRERATRKKARVDVFPEASGNYAIAGRELPIEEVLASRAYIRAVALELRAGGVKGSLRELDLMVFLDLTQGRDPRDHIPARDTGTAPGGDTGTTPGGDAGSAPGGEPGARVGPAGDEGLGGSPASNDEPPDSPREDPAGARGAGTGSPQDSGSARGGASWRRDDADAASRGRDDGHAAARGRDGGDEGVRAEETGELMKRDWRDSADLVAACLAAYDDDAGADGGEDHAGTDGGNSGSQGEGQDADGESGANSGRRDRQRGGPWPFSPPGPGKPGGRAPFPAKINLLVPIGTLLGWSGMPGEAGRDIVDPRTLRDLVHASSHHPATRWCVTVVGADSTAAAHGCARGQHPWTPPPGNPSPGTQPSGSQSSGTQSSGTQSSGTQPSGSPSWHPPLGTGRPRDGTRHVGDAAPGCAPADRARPGTADTTSAGGGPGPGAGKRPPPGQASPPGASRARDAMPAAAQLGQLGQLLSGLNAAVEPIAQGTCDHRHREDRYRPSRVLQDLVRARNATCPAPGCQASSAHSDLDHTRAWPDGDTDECNMGPPCRHDHRLKQAPGWDLTQPAPGHFRWKAPSGRVYHTGPTKYDV